MNTSPLSSRSSRIAFLSVTVLTSLLSGIVGGLLSESSYRSELQSLTTTTLTDRITHQASKEFSASDLLAEVSPSLITLYAKPTPSKPSRSKVMDASLLDQVVTDGQKIGYALASTNDGWLVTPTSTSLDTLDSLIAVDSEKKVYAVEKRVDDKGLGISFIKIKANNLKPFTFSSELEQNFPQNVYLISDVTTITPFVVSYPGYAAVKTAKELVQTTESLQKVFNYSQDFALIGQPVVTSKSGVMGLTAQHGVIPLGYLQSSLGQVLRSGKIARPALGLSYLDNAWLPVPLKNTDGTPRTTGATIAADKVLKLQSGASVTLAAGDVIESVNDERIDKIRSLSEIVQQYKTGDILTLKVVHADKTAFHAVPLQ